MVIGAPMEIGATMEIGSMIGIRATIEIGATTVTASATALLPAFPRKRNRWRRKKADQKLFSNRSPGIHSNYTPAPRSPTFEGDSSRLRYHGNHSVRVHFSRLFLSQHVSFLLTLPGGEKIMFLFIIYIYQFRDCLLPPPM